MSVRGLRGLTDPCSRQEDFASLRVYEVLLSGLDLNRAVKGGLVSNWPLDLEQCSFTPIIQVLRLHTLVHGFPVRPFSGVLFSRADFSLR